MNKQINNKMNRIRKEEQRFLNKKESIFESMINPLTDKIQGYIPDSLKSTLDAAFYKGFKLVFEKGNTYIEKTYNKDKIQLEHDLNDYAIDKSSSKKYIHRMDKYANQSQIVNSSISAIEGGALGLLGIGLPDIPVFISLIMKSIYEIALSYGYGYDTNNEKEYVLLLINGAMTNGGKQKEWNRKINELGDSIDQNIITDIDLEEQMKYTAGVLSDALLTAKFIQGIPVVGAVGGIVNYNIIRKINRFASLKYKKRYYLRKQG